MLVPMLCLSCFFSIIKQTCLWMVLAQWWMSKSGTPIIHYIMLPDSAKNGSYIWIYLILFWDDIEDQYYVMYLSLFSISFVTLRTIFKLLLKVTKPKVFNIHANTIVTCSTTWRLLIKSEKGLHRFIFQSSIFSWLIDSAHVWNFCVYACF